MSDLPPQAWAFIGVVITALAAFIRERLQAEASPYEQMAARLARVEEKAEILPSMRAQLNTLVTWSVDAVAWMTEIEAAWRDEIGEHYVPPPPLPAPRIDRRLNDIGPPPNRGERRGDT